MTAFTFTVHPSVVFKLGADLITDDVQALTELIKNSYDADSPGVDVRIDTHVWTDLRTAETLNESEVATILRERAKCESEIARESERAENSASSRKIEELRAKLGVLAQPVQGRLEVIDAGTGMTLDDIERGWLTVSASRKKEMKERGETTARAHRTPLGDKGLGRLGAQRLGKALDLTTRTVTVGPTLRASIFWDDFAGVESLARVPIAVHSDFDSTPTGTTIVIRGLNSPDEWRNSNGDLTRDLAELISPYSEDLGFRITLRVDDRKIDLRQQSSSILAGSAITYELTYDSGRLSISGRMSIEYLRPDSGPEKISQWNELVSADGGYRFLADLLETQPKKAANLHVRHGDDKRFCVFDSTIFLSNIDGAEAEESDLSDPLFADPGPFDGRVDVIQRRRAAAAAVFDERSAFEDWIKAVSGVRLYRNGFGIRLRTDWLNLASQWTSGKSWYTIRPENVVGYINLTAANNAALEETSNREDIRDTPAYRNFQRLLAAWLLITEDFQTFVRRGYNAYLKKELGNRAGVQPGSSPRELTARVRAQLAQLSQISSAVAEADASLEVARGAVDRLTSSDRSDIGESNASTGKDAARGEALAQVAKAISELQSSIEYVKQLTYKVEGQGEALDLLVQRLEDAEREIRDVWEVVSLGITAETISHEILNLTERLNGRSSQIAKYNDSTLHDGRVGEYIEHVRSASKSMSQEVAHMDSSLRYVRDRREDVEISQLAQSNADYFNGRWNGRHIRAAVVLTDDFHVETSRGKLSQVFDNFLLNSEYWVGESIRLGRIADGFVKIEVVRPYVLISDNGPGVDPSAEELIFDPFVTRKPSGQGRGLGLFVVQQLLNSEHIEVTLDSLRNELGNRFRFRLDFSPAL